VASKHPLDVFRSSSSGFDQASRERRTIAGKVITSRARDDDASAPADNGEPPADTGPEPRVEAPAPSAGARAPKPPRRKRSQKPGKSQKGKPGRAVAPEPTPARVAAPDAGLGRDGGALGGQADPNRAPTTLVPPEPRPLSAPPFGVQRKRNLKAASQLMLYGSCLVVVALMVWVGVQHDWSGDEPLKQGSAVELIDGGPGSEQAAVGGELFTIQAASYSPSEKGQLRAWEALDALLARGYSDVLVTGDQVADGSGAMRLTSCVLLVGRSSDASQLESVLASLGAIDDWPTGSASPFADARIVSHPHPNDG